MKVGFIGLGNVGGKLSGSLLRNGVELSVYDLNPDLVASFAERGATAASGPAELMRDCDAVITCLPSPAASDQVMQMMLPEVRECKIWMEQTHRINKTLLPPRLSLEIRKKNVRS